MARSTDVESRMHNSLDLEIQELVTHLFFDLAQHHPTVSKSLRRDLQTILKRMQAEGVSFVTQTLPILGKATQRGLETGIFEIPKGFRKIKGTALPRLMGGLLKSVFEDNGELRQDVDPACLVDVIQVSNICYKLDLPYSPEKELKVIENFKATEVDLEKLDLRLDDPLLDEASDLVQEVFEGFDPFDIIPRHGPGAVATREKGINKWHFKRKYSSIHRVYPYYTYFTPSRMSLLRNVRGYRQLDSCESGTARVVLVPKDSRGPRLISMEPLEYQFLQQGLARAIVDRLENHPSTRGRVNFTDQTINRRLALWNSVTRKYSTLDMKEASDRVSVVLVERIFSKVPTLLKCLLALRTASTELPDSTILPLRKFAPMGSAICFPVEALVFYVLAEAIRRRERIAGKVYVYGDDLIVPVSLTPFLLSELPSFGLKFNEDKCFTRGNFRESCGMDAFKGFICTPTRMRKKFPQNRKDAGSIVSAVEFSNALFKRGYWRTAEYVRQIAERFVHVGCFTRPTLDFAGLSYASFTSKGVTIDDSVKVKYGSTRTYSMRHLIRTPVAKCKQKNNNLLSEGRLFC